MLTKVVVSNAWTIADSTDWYLNSQFILRTYGSDAFYATIAGDYHSIGYISGIGEWDFGGVNLAFKAPCPSPSNGFSETNISSYVATVNWSALPCAVGYKVEYRICGSDFWRTKNIKTNSPKAKLKDLSPNTLYYWKVKTKCSADPNLFSDYSVRQSFTTAPLKLADDNESSKMFSVYPNPAQNFITIKTLLTDELWKMKITNLVGEVMQAEEFDSDNQRTISVSELPAGIYFISLSSTDITQTEELIKNDLP